MCIIVTMENNIKQYRKIKKMTQSDLAVKIMKDRSMIARYEQGMVDIPGSALASISKVLKVSIRKLLK